MNVPGRADGNWRWRATEDMLSGPAFERLRDLTEASSRTRFTQNTVTQIPVRAVS